MRALLRLLCIVYPREFRDRYLAQILSDYAQHESEGGAGAAFALNMMLDVLATGLPMRFEFLARDLSSAVRRLRHAPLLVAVVIVTFALGIGANIVVFSVLNAVLLRPLPYPNSARLVSIATDNARSTTVIHVISMPDLSDLRTRSTTLAAAAAFNENSQTLTGEGKPVALSSSQVTWRFFDTLGVRPELGRFFTAADGRQPASTSVVISSHLWRSRFGGDPQIIGRTIKLDGVANTVIGVAPPGFESPEPYLSGFFPADVWTVTPESVAPQTRGARYLFAIGLLRPGVSLASAQADLTRVQTRLDSEYPRFDRHYVVLVASLRDAILGGTAPALLWMIFAAVVGVFLIMCANVASLLLSQSNARSHELSMRMALGASRRRILTQLLTESGLLAVCGGAVGLGAAYAALHAFIALASEQVPRLASASIDVPVLLYALAAVIAATMIAGAAPSWMLISTSALSIVRTAGRGKASPNARVQSSLVVAEVAIALALVTASGLALRSFYALTHADLGIRTTGILAGSLFALPEHRFPSADSKRIALDELQSRLDQIPGAQSALAVSYPMSGANMRMTFEVSGKPAAPGNAPIAAMDSVSPNFFSVLGLRLEQGRLFNAGDRAASAPVAIIDEAAMKYFGGGNVIGKRLRMPIPNDPSPAVWRTIVGIVSNDRNGPAALPDPMIYLSIDQATMPWISAVIYAPDGQPAVRMAVARAFSATDPQSQAPDLRTMPQLMADSASSARLSAALFTTLGLIALALAVAGVFGVVSYSVAQRFQEFGIRMAIGSSAGGVVRTVLSSITVIVGLGVAIGLVLAAIAGRAVGSQLYEVQSVDPVVLTAVTLLLVATALLAALLPALRAARVDPASALRYE